MNTFKILLTIILIFIAGFLGAIAYKMFFSEDAVSSLSVLEKHAVICEFRESYYINGGVEKSRTLLLKRFANSKKKKTLFLNDSTLKIYNFKSKELAKSFMIEVYKHHWSLIITDYHIE